MIGTRRLVLVGGASLVLHETAFAKNKKKTKRRKKHSSGGGSVDHEAIIVNLAAQLRFGLTDDKTSIEKLESRIAQGNLVECQCSKQAWLVVRAIRRAGGRARNVGSFMYPFPPRPGNGHEMMEVYSGGQWLCYDVMCKVQALDDSGNPCSLDAWCASQQPGWRRFADDGGYYPREADLPGIYGEILGTPWVRRSDDPRRAVFYSTDAKDAARIMAYYEWLEKVPLKEWNKVIS